MCYLVECWCVVMVPPNSLVQMCWIEASPEVTICLPWVSEWWYPVCWFSHLNDDFLLQQLVKLLVYQWSNGYRTFPGWMHNRNSILLEVYVVCTWEFTNSFKAIWICFDQILTRVYWSEFLHILLYFLPFWTRFVGFSMLPELNWAVKVNNPQPAARR